MKYGHLERVEVKLQAVSPVYIGSGEELTKKEYIFDKSEKVIYMPDLARLTHFLSERSMLSAFEDFLLHPYKNDLYVFLSEHGISKKDYPEFVSYLIDAGEIAYSEHFRGVMTFMKGADGLPYIPGSSLKGAIRTAIASKLLEKGDFSRNIAEIETAAEDFRSPQRYISRESDFLTNRIFCRLEIEDPKNPDRIRWDNIINNFMKGISVSDSAPINSSFLTLCGKFDRKPDGTTKELPLYRECLAPGTMARFVLTMDRTVMDKVGIDIHYIREALQSFSLMQYDSFEKFFPKMTDNFEGEKLEGVDIIIGGGAGYASKTIVYPLIRERERALRLVSGMMVKQFRNHKHERDIAYKVSPHTIKLTKYKGKDYQMGKCRINFE